MRFSHRISDWLYRGSQEAKKKILPWFSESSSEFRRTYSKTLSRPRQPFWAPWWPLGIFGFCSLSMVLVQEGLKSFSKRQITFVYTTFQTLSLSLCFFVSLSLYNILNDQRPIWDLEIPRVLARVSTLQAPLYRVATTLVDRYFHNNFLFFSP